MDDYLDFNFDENDLYEETELSQLEETALTVLDQIGIYLDNAKNAITFKEEQNIKPTILVLNSYMASLLDMLNIMDDNELSEEDKLEKIEALKFRSTDISFTDMVESKNVSGEQILDAYNKKKNEEENGDDSATDW